MPETVIAKTSSENTGSDSNSVAGGGLLHAAADAVTHLRGGVNPQVATGVQRVADEMERQASGSSNSMDPEEWARDERDVFSPIPEMLEERKVLREKEKEVAKWIKGATATAAGIGALPIPGSDIVPLTTLQVGLAMKIAFIYDIKPSKDDVMKLIASTVTGNVGKQIARTAITLLKAAGWIPGNQLLEVTICGIAASVAASLTFGFGWACNAYYKSGMTIDLGEIKDVFENSYNEYKKKSEKE